MPDAHYDPSGFFGKSSGGARIGGARRFRGDPLDGKQDPSPGPGAYSTTESKGWSKGVSIPRAKSAGGSARTSRHFDPKEENPGPASYGSTAVTSFTGRGMPGSFSRAKRQPIYSSPDREAPGPGDYEEKRGSAIRATGIATFGRAKRQAIYTVADTSAGPGSYNACVNPSSDRKISTPGTFSRAARRSLHGTRTDSNVGPGSYEGTMANPSSTRKATSGPASFGKAPKAKKEVINDAPGPGAYDTATSGFVSARARSAPGGVIARSTRSAPFRPPESPGVGAYATTSGGHDDWSKKSKGGVIGKSRTTSHFHRPPSDSPGPGSYTPVYAAAASRR